ncbi:hypothetical protein A9F13_20g01122 [Clavispora lusitaniae]|nr:hypothetical protein A9F13_20g01122 [Clavispora lusitaniae]
MSNHQQLHPHHGQSSSRKPSVVEMLSSPPPLPADQTQTSIDEISLSRNTSISSRSSSVIQPTVNWSEILLADLTEANKLITINSSCSVQKAYETLVDHNLTSVPVVLSQSDDGSTNYLSFDYSDLNTYLLLIMNRISVDDVLPSQDSDGRRPSLQERKDTLTSYINRAKKGEEVPVEIIVSLQPKTPFLRFKESDTLLKAVEVFGSGAHRVAIINNDNKISGILSQRRTIKFFWDNARRFTSLDYLLNSSLQDLKVISSNPVTIQGDCPLIEALEKMFTERMSSLAVIDKNKSLVGNISIVDVKNVSSTNNSHLLFKPVTTFISYNLSQKGIEKGQDQFPIFHVNPQTSLARVIAKLVATQSHRLWIVEARTSHYSVSNGPGATVETALAAESPVASAAATSIQFESGRPGKLIGVVTLTDILALFAQCKSGVKIDTQSARNQRRRSSTSTTRSSLDGVSGSITTPTTPKQPSVPINQEMFRKSYQTGKGDNVFSNE